MEESPKQQHISASILRASATGSGADRWMNCHGSVSLGLGIKERPKKYTDEGTKKHKAAQGALERNIPEEEIEDEHVRGAVEYVRSVSAGPYICETRLPLLGSSGGIDCYVRDGRVAHLFDFKFGFGVKLYAQDNMQLAFYACAIRERHSEIKTVHAHLIQPTIEGIFEDTPSVSTWVLPYQTLDALKRRFEEALCEVERAKTLSFGPWCRFCPAKGCCPIYTAYNEAAEQEQSNLPIVSEKLDPAAIPVIARILAKRKRIEGWFDKAEEYLLGLALAGEHIPGFQLARKRSNRKYVETLTEEQIAAELVSRGIEDPYERSLIPLTKAEKKVNIDDLVYKPEGGHRLKLVEED